MANPIAKDKAPVGTAYTAADTKAKQGEGGATPDPIVSRYWREIERYERAVADWYEDADQIIKVYLDENRGQSTSSRRFALLWANVETLKPAVYTKPPSLVCSRRFKDRDPVARVCSELLERAGNTTFDLYGIDEVFRMVRDDRLLVGRGQAWVRYEATIERYDDPTGEKDENGEPVQRERLKAEKACADHVAWDEFGHNVSRTWNEVWMVWRIVYKTRDEIEDRFGADVAARLTYNCKMPGQGSGSAKDEPEDRAKVYEIWDKRRGTASWIAKGVPQFLDDGPPPIDFRDFFPCPEPCFATKTSKSLIPKPDYTYYRDQAKEINDLTEKIGNLMGWLQVKAFVPGGPSSIADPIEEALREKSNQELFVPVQGMTEWTERGGASKLIDWLPLDMVVKTLQAAINARGQLIQDVFQITGLSDILRGQTDPDETLGAQQLKAQTGNRRLRNTRDEISRFTRDIGRLVAEVIAEKFEPQSIADITGYKYVPQQQMMQPGMPMLPGPSMQNPMAALMGQIAPPPQGMQSDLDPDLVFDDRHIELLRNDRMRNFRIDVETDSTVQADENAEKQGRMEFVTTVGGYLEKATLILEKAPVLAPVVQEILMFLARGFRAGKGMEETLESAFVKLDKALQQKANQPNPQVIEAQLNAQLAEKEAAAEMAVEREKAANEMQLAQQKQQGDFSLAVRKQDLDATLKTRQIAVTANAQAQDRVARAMLDLKPSGAGSDTRH